MKGFALALLFTLSSAVAATAQTDLSYRFDNFDFASGVRIEKPPQPALKRNTRRGKVRAAAEPIAAAGLGLVLRAGVRTAVHATHHHNTHD